MNTTQQVRPITAPAAAGGPAKTARIALWTAQVTLAAAMVGAGLAKLGGAAEMVALFEAVGVGQWLRILTGVLEVAGGLLLLVPSASGPAALLLAGVLAGATLTELFVLPDGSVLKPLPLLLVAVFVTWGRRDAVLPLLGRGGRSATTEPWTLEE